MPFATTWHGVDIHSTYETRHTRLHALCPPAVCAAHHQAASRRSKHPTERLTGRVVSHQSHSIRTNTAPVHHGHLPPGSSAFNTWLLECMVSLLLVLMRPPPEGNR